MLSILSCVASWFVVVVGAAWAWRESSTACEVERILTPRELQRSSKVGLIDDSVEMTEAMMVKDSVGRVLSVFFAD